MQQAYEEADLIISPERYCSYGLSISEALAIGKPTVLSNIPTYQEIAEGFKHAYFFETGDSSSLAEQIELAVSRILSCHAADIVKFRSKYDFRECAKKYGELYIQSLQEQTTRTYCA